MTVNQERQFYKFTPAQFLLRLFDKYDYNGDGRLSTFQFNDLLKFLAKVMGATFPGKAEVKDLFYWLDLDSDSTISKQEYRKLTGGFQKLISQLGISLVYRKENNL